MRFKNNYDIGHAFFHSDERRGTHCTMSYQGNRFYSYATQIGHIYKSPVDDRTYFISSFYSFSNTTTQHRSVLEDCSPYAVIRAPFEYGGEYNIEDIPALYIKTLRQMYETNDHLKYAEHRKKFIELYDYFMKFLDITGIKVVKGTLEELKAIYDLAVTAIKGSKRKEAISEIGQLREKALAAKHKKELTDCRKNLPKVLHKSISGLAAVAYSDSTLLLDYAKQYCTKSRVRNDEAYTCQIDGAEYNANSLAELALIAERTRPDIKSFAKQYLKLKFPSNSYIWRIDDVIYTSKYIDMPYDVCKAAYDRYKEGTLKAGMHVGTYTIEYISNVDIKIGCHVIRWDNIEEVFGGAK